MILAEKRVVADAKHRNVVWYVEADALRCIDDLRGVHVIVGKNPHGLWHLCQSFAQVAQPQAGNGHFEYGGKKGTELCDVVHWMRLNAALYRATGDAKAPEFVRKAYNGAFLAGILDGGRWCMQFVKPDGSGKPADLQVNMKRHHCCVDNMPRGFIVAESMATVL